MQPHTHFGINGPVIHIRFPTAFYPQDKRPERINSIYIPSEVDEISYDSSSDNSKTEDKYLIEDYLHNNFPSVYVIIHSVLLILTGLAQVILQLFIIINGQPVFAAQGIWGGVIAIFLAIVAIIVCNYTL